MGITTECNSLNQMSLKCLESWGKRDYLCKIYNIKHIKCLHKKKNYNFTEIKEKIV